MSGPKYGEASIDMSKLNELISDMKGMLEDAKRMKMNDIIAEICRETQKLKNECREENYDILLKEAEKIMPETSELKAFREHIKLFEQLSAQTFYPGMTSSELIITKLLYEEHQGKIKNVMALLQESGEHIKAEYDKMQALSEEERFILRDWETKENQKIDICSPKVREAYDSVISELIGVKNFTEIKNTLDSIISNTALDDEYKIKQLYIRRDALKIENNPEYLAECEKLKADFYALSEKLEIEADPPLLLPQLKEAVAKLEEEAKQKTMSRYISDSIGEVMTELGYNIIGSEVLDDQKHSAEKNYYDFSENSAINVAVSDSGAVLFEVMGKQETLSDSEKLNVKHDMDKFCPDYQRVKEKLKEYGITLQKEHLCEADVRYVRGIDADKLNGQTQRRTQKKTKRMSFNG